MQTIPPAKHMLVISPHADDEVIGCGGAIARAAAEGTTVHVVVMAAGGIQHRHHSSAVLFEERFAEFQACAHILGVSDCRVLFPGLDMQLETLSMLQLVSALDRVVGEMAFEDIFIPEPSHNLDHRLTHAAAVAALRPGGPSLRPALVAMYEGMASRTWCATGAGGALYVEISSVIELKMAGLAEYRSQLKPFPHPTSVEAVRALASFRGAECGAMYAERFQIIHQFR